MPLDLDLLRRLRMEPLDRDRHDRAAFFSGEPRIDAYLKTRAAGLMDVEGTRVWVACLEGSPDIVGFHALNSHGIDATRIPKAMRRRLPRDHLIPAVFLSNVGVAATHQGRGIGRFLVADAFKKVIIAADAVGSAFVVLDAINERAAALYDSLGFIALPTPPGRMIIGMRQVRAAIAAAARV